VLKHYLVTAYRAATREKLHSGINLAGLVMGIAASALIYLWVTDELSYDAFHAHSESLYRIEQDQHGSAQIFHVNITSEPMGKAVQDEIPEVIRASRLGRMGEVLLRQNETAFYQDGTRYVDPEFFAMFSFALLEGDGEKALTDPASAVITPALGNKLFAREDHLLGESFTLNNQHRLVVAGVIEEAPSNSRFQFSLLVSADFARSIGAAGESWNSNQVPTYVQLVPGADVDDVSEKISALNYLHTSDGLDAADLPKTDRGTPAWRAEYSLRKVSDIRLTGYFGYGRSVRMKYVYILSCVGAVILVIACINFMNLAISRATRRSREVGLRKTVGAIRSQLTVQYFGETMVMALLSAAIALLVVYLVLPTFNTWSGKQLTLELFGNSHLLLGIVGIVLVTAFAAGVYPALVMASFKPRAFLGGQVPVTPLGRALRRLTVTAQFVISAALLIGTGVVLQQTEFMTSKDLGYNPKNLIWFQLRGDMGSRYEAFRHQALTDDNILAVTASYQHPAFNSANGSVDWPGKTEENAVPVGFNFVDYEYCETMGIEIIEGRTFDRRRPADSGVAFVINEEFAALITEGPVIGATVAGDGKVIGVARSFHRTSLRRAIEPTILVVSPTDISMVLVRLSEDDRAAGIAAVEQTFASVFPDYPFDFSFFEEDLGRSYQSQKELSQVLQASVAVAIFVACLGMFGLASFSAERRMKEMAVRKVLGASSKRLFGMLAREYLIVVGIANLLAAPLAYYFANEWLQDFPYRVEFDYSLILLAVSLTLLVALIAVSKHSLRAAANSPASVLKIE
jgi:ABC-type antimicrobial peptide transport system permease subunit